MTHQTNAHSTQGYCEFFYEATEMKNIAISTAAFCLWGITPQEKLDHCRELQFSEIEIALSTERMVRDYLIFLEETRDFSSFQRVSVHAPWHRVSYGHNNRTRRILNDLALIAQRIPVEEFVFHIDNIENMEVLTQWGQPVCLENSDTEGEIKTLSDALMKTDFSLALNINRGARRRQHLEEILLRFRHRVSRIHVSGYDGRHGRMPILAADQLSILDRIKGIPAPIILEGLFPSGDLSAILRERQAVWQKT